MLGILEKVHWLPWMMESIFGQSCDSVLATPRKPFKVQITFFDGDCAHQTTLPYFGRVSKNSNSKIKPNSKGLKSLWAFVRTQWATEIAMFVEGKPCFEFETQLQENCNWTWQPTQKKSIPLESGGILSHSIAIPHPVMTLLLSSGLERSWHIFSFREVWLSSLLFLTQLYGRVINVCSGQKENRPDNFPDSV